MSINAGVSDNILVYDCAQKLRLIEQNGHLRKFRRLKQADGFVDDGSFEDKNSCRKAVNLSGNDYLGMAEDKSLFDKFCQAIDAKNRWDGNHFFDCLDLEDFTHHMRFSASSSRILTGNFDAMLKLEALILHSFYPKLAITSDQASKICYNAHVIVKDVLLFNSGYHLNIGVLEALGDKDTLFIADKLVHASIIDGVRLSNAKLLRYRHQDLTHLGEIIQQNHRHYKKIIILTESIFSMDGDITDITALVKLKNTYDNVFLYIDEAHAVGVYDAGLGVAKAQGCLDEVDFLVGTFGKALASIGAFLLCHKRIKSYLVNTARTLIFSTALPPMQILWTLTTYSKMLKMQKQRDLIAQYSTMFKQNLARMDIHTPSSSHIIPIITGNNLSATIFAQKLQDDGFYVLPIRTPTVPKNQARVRICMHSRLKSETIDALLDSIYRHKKYIQYE